MPLQEWPGRLPPQIGSALAFPGSNGVECQSPGLRPHPFEQEFICAAKVLAGAMI